MSLKIRLARRGRSKRVFYHIVVADSRSPRDGRFIEKLGVYNPLTNPASIELDNDKALSWLLKGAQPSETVKAMLSYRGILYKKHLQIGVQKGAITQEQADSKFNEWLKNKEGAIEGKKERLSKAQQDAKDKALAAEKAKNEARAEALRQKEAEAIAAVEKEGEATEDVVEQTEETPESENQEQPEA